MNDRRLHDRLSTLAEDLAPPFDPARQADAARRRHGRRRSRLVAVATVAAVAVGVPAVVLASRPLWSTTAEERLLDALAPDGAAGDGGGGAYCGPMVEDLGSVAELLPNTRYRTPDGVERPRTEAVVVGRFTSVEPGRGYVLPVPDGPSDLPVPFDDPASLYRTVHARLAVETVVAGDVRTDTVLVGFTVRGTGPDAHHGPTLETVEEGLPALGTVVLFLDRYRHADEDPSVHGLASYYGATASYQGASHALLGQLEDDGGLRLPLFPADEAERLVAATPTLEALQDAAREPIEVIEVGICGERLD